MSRIFNWYSNPMLLGCNIILAIFAAFVFWHFRCILIAMLHVSILKSSQPRSHATCKKDHTIKMELELVWSCVLLFYSMISPNTFIHSQYSLVTDSVVPRPQRLGQCLRAAKRLRRRQLWAKLAPDLCANHDCPWPWDDQTMQFHVDSEQAT